MVVCSRNGSEFEEKIFFYIYSYFRLILVKKSATHKTEKRGETDESKRLSLRRGRFHLFLLILVVFSSYKVLVL